MEPTAAGYRPGALDAATIAEAFRIPADERPDDVAVRTQGGAIEWTWADLRARVDALAAGLSRLGGKRGDSVALQLSNRPEFHQCDRAGIPLGAPPFSIYNPYAPQQIEFVVSD